MRQAWRRAWITGTVATGLWAQAAAAQGVVQIRQTLVAPVPAVAVLSATTMLEPTEARATTRRWRAVLRTGANDRHRLTLRGQGPGWTVRVADAPAGPPEPLGGGEIVIREALTRGYHDVTLILEGPGHRVPVVDAVVRTTQVPGGFAVAALTPPTR